MKKTLLAAAATFVLFSTAAFAQVEQPSQITCSGDGPDYERFNVGFHLNLKSRDEVRWIPAGILLSVQ